MERKYYTTEEVAAALGLAVVTLAKWRAVGKGPKFVKPSPGMVRYRIEDIDEWMTAQERPLTQAEEGATCMTEET
jgi:predicted DNA-binding transcriptional regulator AlpA